MSTARSRVGVAVVNGLLYAIGGYDGQSRLRTVEVYNPETDTWTKVASMNTQRRLEILKLSCLIYEGIIFYLKSCLIVQWERIKKS